MTDSRRSFLPSALLATLACCLSLVLLTGCGEPASVAGNPAGKKYVPAADEPEAKQPADAKAPPADEKQPEAAPVSKPAASDAPPPAPKTDDAPPPPANEAAAETPPAAAITAHPFPRRAPLAQIFERDIFPRDADWLNTSGPLTLKDLKGKFVLLDFWTYCCINCMHILPELKKLEHKYPNELVVIGVHSAKFDGEKDTQNIADAVLRYEIEHPVVNDPEHKLWDMIGVQSWPTVVLIDPEGNLVYGRPGEFKAEEFVEILDRAIPFYEKAGTLSRTPIKFDQLAAKAPKTPLRYPGKVLADEASNRLFISDSNHNRIVIADLSGKLLDVIGTGAMGRNDGGYAEATFDHPQGCALVGDTLYVADTENHLLRKIDLKAKQVTTIAGTGKQGKYAWPGIEEITDGKLPDRWVGKPATTAINSPWALLAHENKLYIAMAGPHQIWVMPLDESEIGPYAGNGREDIVDGKLVPQEPYMLGYSSFAQPSGLSTDGTWLYVADSEGSSIRAVPFDPTQLVRTVVGTSELEGGRLFAFGDVDGPKSQAKLQHPLDVAYHNGLIYVADTYNNKIKTVDAKTGEVKTFAGEGPPGKTDSPAAFDEPTGLSIAGGKLYVADTNNNLLRVVDLASGKVSTLTIEGLTPAQVSKKDDRPDFSDAMVVNVPAATLKPVDGKVTLQVKLALPVGWKINNLAPALYFADELNGGQTIAPESLGKQPLAMPATDFDIVLPVKGPGETTVAISMNYYYCQGDAETGVCKVGSVVFNVPIKIADDAENSTALLSHTVPE